MVIHITHGLILSQSGGQKPTSKVLPELHFLWRLQKFLPLLDAACVPCSRPLPHITLTSCFPHQGSATLSDLPSSYQDISLTWIIQDSLPIAISLRKLLNLSTSAMFVLSCQVTFTVPGIKNKVVLGVKGVFPSTTPFLAKRKGGEWSGALGYWTVQILSLRGGERQPRGQAWKWLREHLLLKCTSPPGSPGLPGLPSLGVSSTIFF